MTIQYDAFVGLTVPGIPDGSAIVNGGWVSSLDGSSVPRLISSTSGVSTLQLPVVGNGPANYNCIFSFASASLASNYLYITIGQNSTQRKLAISCSPSETRGCIWFQDNTQNVLLGDFVGASNTLSAGVKYSVTIKSSGISPTTLTAELQRLSDNMWLDSTGTWQSTHQIAVTAPDSYYTTLFSTCYFISDCTAPNYSIYSLTCDYPQVVRPSNLPVLAKGATYNGWQADALAAPQVTWNGSQYVMSVSVWQDSTSQWASAFFTSSDLKSWTYVPNSLIVPTTLYIYGNAGFMWWQSKYWFVGIGAPGMMTSTDLLTWTMVTGTEHLVSDGFDHSLSINPGTNKLEIWFAQATGSIRMWDTSNGTSYTDQGTVYSNGGINGGGNAEPAVFYIGSVRYMALDVFTFGTRATMLSYSTNQDTTWVVTPLMLSAVPANSWEKQQNFDCQPFVTDIGDGHGAIAWYIFAGSDNTSGTDATNSSIGLAAQISLVVPPAISIPSVSGLVAGGNTTISGTFLNGTPTGLSQNLDSVVTNVGTNTITTIAGTGNASNGTYSYIITTPAAGNHSISVVGTGIYASNANGFTFFTTTAVAPPTITAPSVSGYVSGGSSTISGSFAHGAPAGLSQNLDGTITTVSSPTITTSNGSGNSANGTYSYTLVTPAPGTHSIRIMGTGTFAANSNATSFTTAGIPTISAPSVNKLMVISGTFANGAPTGLKQTLNGVTTNVSNTTITTTSGTGNTAIGTYNYTTAVLATGSYSLSIIGVGTFGANSTQTGFSESSNGAGGVANRWTH